jgi:beta-N-acetylhexosaminidase
VELRAGTNLAVGSAKWSLAEPLDRHGLLARACTVTEAGPPVAQVLTEAAGTPLVVAVRDAHRSAWQRDWLHALTAQRPDAVLVAVGMPIDVELVSGPAIAGHGAARVVTQAVADLLRG